MVHLVASSESVVFDYKLSGTDWGIEHPTCSTGLAQSPIDLKDPIAKLSEVISVRGFNYPNDVNLVINRNKATPLPADLNSEFEVKFANGTTGNFYPLQFHFHSPSEHTINGRQFDLELHIVHGDKTKTAASVLGILFEISNSTMA